ncbi:MAG: hypothetical protein Ct9H90mP11_02170 [Acidimicrobiales bacterium]|nr:MAG: hypothetical protein Ct9H90mP11_02170 [Acidimicrobiales bacterium]
MSLGDSSWWTIHMAGFSISPVQYQKITRISLLLLAFIIVTGAAVRLSGSGLGCSDWPTCENDQLVAEIDDVHAMVEFVNRVITGFVASGCNYCGFRLAL